MSTSSPHWHCQVGNLNDAYARSGPHESKLRRICATQRVISNGLIVAVLIYPINCLEGEQVCMCMYVYVFNALKIICPLEHMPELGSDKKQQLGFRQLRRTSRRFPDVVS